MGAQSAHADELALLGRIHSAERPAEALALARSHGFQRLSLDLMFAFPGHTPERWDETLEWIAALDLEHVSAYAFIPEPGTPLGDGVGRGQRSVPDDDTQASMYERLTARLWRSGLHAYETSNFCRAGAEARHNLVYWLRRPYLALGPSAHGFWYGERYGNHYATTRWSAALERGESPEAEREPEEARGRDRELLMLGLRLTQGLEPTDHDPAAWRALALRYGVAWRAAIAQGRLEPTRLGGVRIPDGLRFVADDVIAWLDIRADDVEVDGGKAGGWFDTHADRFLPSMACQNSHSPAA
jgi:oxygen-independent coproporphyrinogen-3 oxidase